MLFIINLYKLGQNKQKDKFGSLEYVKVADKYYTPPLKRLNRKSEPLTGNAELVHQSVSSF
jgi:hypothetical protein